MNEFIAPLVLSEAVIALYPADKSGLPISSQEVFVGGSAEMLSIAPEVMVADLTPTGAQFPDRHGIVMGYNIRIGRLVAVSRTNLAMFDPHPNQRFVMSILWDRGQVWHRRTFYGVRCLGAPMESNSIYELRDAQGYFAQRYVADSGYGLFSPASVVNSDVDQVFFSRAGASAANDYLLGAYTWPSARTPTKAKAIAKAGQTSSTVLTLEVNGALTGHTITLPVGAVGAEVAVEINIAGLTVPVGHGVRWKVTSAPASSSDQVTGLAVVLRA